MMSIREALESLAKFFNKKTVHFYINSTLPISQTMYPAVPFRLLSIDLHASAVLDTLEVLTITKDAGRSSFFDTVLLSEDLFIGDRTSYHATFGEGYEFAAGDKLVIAQLNGSSDDIGIDITYETL